jgi:hypothetical protein
MAEYKQKTKFKRKLNTGLMKFAEEHRSNLAAIAVARAKNFQ